MSPRSIPPTVSVVIPTHNRRHVLSRAVDSVLGQTFQDLEIVVVDDGSTDGTMHEVPELKDPRVRCIRFETNQGIGAARSRGVSEARAGLIAFLDSDDRWKPGKLTRLVAAFERHADIDVAFSDYENINYVQNTRDRGFALAEDWLSRLRVVPLSESWWMIEAEVPEALLRGNFVGTASVMAVRRRVFDRAGNFRPDLSGPEDFEFLWRAAVLGARFAYTTDVLVERHKDSDSITARQRAFALQRLQALDVCEETARLGGRPDLLGKLGLARARTYCDLIEACALEGRRLEAIRAFWSSRRFGWSSNALKYLTTAVAGPRIVSLTRRLLRRPATARWRVHS